VEIALDTLDIHCLHCLQHFTFWNYLQFLLYMLYLLFYRQLSFHGSSYFFNNVNRVANININSNVLFACLVFTYRFIDLFSIAPNDTLWNKINKTYSYIFTLNANYNDRHEELENPGFVGLHIRCTVYMEGSQMPVLLYQGTPVMETDWRDVTTQQLLGTLLRIISNAHTEQMQ